MPKRQLADKSHHDVPGLPDVSEVQNHDQHGEQVISGKYRRGDQRHKQGAEKGQTARRNICDQTRDHAVLLPMMPCGRSSNTRTRMANANMLLADGENRRPAIASVKPIRTPPINAPGIEPRPPVMTMTNASS